MKKVLINPGVVFKQDDRGVVKMIRVDIDDDELWEIDGILAEVWMALSEGKDIEKIEEIISTKHEVTLEETKMQIERFIKKLIKMKLIEC